jgi:hypothetical protein
LCGQWWLCGSNIHRRGSCWRQSCLLSLRT